MTGLTIPENTLPIMEYMDKIVALSPDVIESFCILITTGVIKALLKATSITDSTLIKAEEVKISIITAIIIPIYIPKIYFFHQSAF